MSVERSNRVCAVAPRLVAALSALLLMASGGCTVSQPPSVLLITIDTLRADHLTTYGYARPTAPTIDALAAGGVVFETMFSVAPETTPAFASMMTGRWPADLKVRGNSQRLDAGAHTLATELRAHGWSTAAFVSGYPLVRKLSGLEVGFDHYDDAMPDARGRFPNVQRSASKTTDAALEWLASGEPSPFFAWVHYYDPHGDYSPGPPYDSLFPGSGGPILPLDEIPAYQQLGPEQDAAVFIGRYDGEIRRTDDQIARLLAGLGALGLLERTIVVVTADHGESLVEHGYYFDHGKEVYSASLHVPLIVAGPGIPDDGRRVPGVVRTPDIPATLLDLLELEPVPSFRGRSVAPWIEAPPDVREAVSEARFAHRRSQAAYRRTGPKTSVRSDRFSAILRLTDGAVELYDRRDDPAETVDLLGPGNGDSDEATELRGILADALRSRLATTASGREAPTLFDEATVRRIEALAESRVADAAGMPSR